MLGNIVKILKPEPLGEYSSKFTDLIYANAGSVSKKKLVTLEPQKEIHDEFWLYASYATGWCPRACAIAAAFGRAQREIKPDLQWGFDIGKAMHEMLQQRLIPQDGNNPLLGAWIRRGKTNIRGMYRDVESGYKNEIADSDVRDVVRGWGKRPKGFEGRDGWKFKEPKIRMLDYRVVIKMDGIIGWEDIGEEPFDIKTVDLREYDLLNPLLGGKPKEATLLQGQLTMWATNTQRFRVVYVFKGEGSIKRAIFEHIVYRDDAEISRLKGVALECVGAVRDVDKYKKDNGLKNGDFIVDEAMRKDVYEKVIECHSRRAECPMKSKGFALKCDERDECFPGRGKKKTFEKETV